MKKHIWANPTKDWEGFRFAAYSLDSKKVCDLPLSRKSLKDGKTEQIPTTVGDAHASIVERHFEVNPDSVLGVQVTADNERLEFGGPSFNCQILREVLQLRKDGVNPFSARWFWYDSDSCTEDPIEHYAFFVVHDDKIVCEQVTFSDHHENGFDPDIFKTDEETDFIWSNDLNWSEAWTRYWYRKFYNETRTGQLMVLRPDEPPLYHYQRTQTNNSVPEAQPVALLRTYRLLWVALPLLAAIAFPSIKNYMGIAAIALGFDFLLVCWQTRTKN